MCSLAFLQKDPALLYGRAQIQSCCQASEYRVCGDDEVSLEGISALVHANHGAEVRHLEETLKSISTFHNEVSQTSFTALMDDASCTRKLLLFQEYLVAIGNDKPLTAFWTSYLDMTGIPLGLLRAAR